VLSFEIVGLPDAKEEKAAKFQLNYTVFRKKREQSSGLSQMKCGGIPPYVPPY